MVQNLVSCLYLLEVICYEYSVLKLLVTQNLIKFLVVQISVSLKNHLMIVYQAVRSYLYLVPEQAT